MAMISKHKLLLLKEAFVRDGLLPSDAAKKVGVTYATANRYYEKWADEIQLSLERQLVPKIRESIELSKSRKPKADAPASPRSRRKRS